MNSNWSFITNHGVALVCIAAQPDIRMRELAERLGITERAAQRIVAALIEAGYVTRERTGRRNRYSVHPGLPFRRPTLRDAPAEIGDLLAIFEPTAAGHGKPA